MGINKKISSMDLRKEVWEYTRLNEQFTSHELNVALGINNDKGSTNLNVVGKFLKEMVSWNYLSTVKEGVTYRYYVNIYL